MSVSLTSIRIEEGLWECVARSNPCNQLFAFFSFICPRHPDLKTGTLRPASWSDAHRPFYLPVDLTEPPAAKLRLDGSIIVPCMLPGNQTVPSGLFRFSVDRSFLRKSWRQKTCCSTYKDMNRRAAYFAVATRHARVPALSYADCHEPVIKDHKVLSRFRREGFLPPHFSYGDG